MAYLKRKTAEWVFPALAAIILTWAMTPAGDALPVGTWTYEGVCREITAGTTEGRQALVGSLWHAPLPTIAGLPAAALLPRGTALPLATAATLAGALACLLHVLLRFCRRLLPPLPASGAWLACVLLLARMPALTVEPRQAVNLAVAVATILKLADWFEGQRLGDLVKFAFSLALLVLCGAPLGGWTMLLAAMFIAIAASDRATRSRLQGLLILGLLPALYALGIWLLMSRLILSDALYAWRFLIGGLVSWQGLPAFALTSGQIGTLAFCALAGTAAAMLRARRTAMLGASGVALCAWRLLLKGYGLDWAAGTTDGLLALTALLTLFSAVRDIASAYRPAPLRGLAIAALGLFYIVAAIIPPPPPPVTDTTQRRGERRAILDSVEAYVNDRTPYGRTFVCGYRGLGLLEGVQRDRFVACLDLHIGTLRERYERQNLFLMVPRPVADAAHECTVWRHHDIYANGVSRTLFAGDWGDWRLYEIITAPTAEQLLEWRE